MAARLRLSSSLSAIAAILVALCAPLSLGLPLATSADSAAEVARSTDAAPWWQSGVISHWYAPDNDWPSAVDIVKAHAPLVTSVMSYCGIDVANNGTMIIAFHDTCVDTETGDQIPLHWLVRPVVRVTLVGVVVLHADAGVL